MQPFCLNFVTQLYTVRTATLNKPATSSILAPWAISRRDFAILNSLKRSDLVAFSTKFSSPVLVSFSKINFIFSNSFLLRAVESFEFENVEIKLFPKSHQKNEFFEKKLGDDLYKQIQPFGPPFNWLSMEYGHAVKRSIQRRADFVKLTVQFFSKSYENFGLSS